MGWMGRWKFGLFRGNQPGVASLIVLLCVCILIQMLGLPVTFLSLLDSDNLLKLEPGSEDFSSPSQLLYPRTLIQVTETAHSLSMLQPQVLLKSFFHPPTA